MSNKAKHPVQKNSLKKNFFRARDIVEGIILCIKSARLDYYHYVWSSEQYQEKAVSIVRCGP